jgi:hypothetical protein
MLLALVKKTFAFFACVSALLPLRVNQARRGTPSVVGDLGNQEGTL